MIPELIAIIEKNIRRLIRSKLSALIILLGPLVLIGIIGMAFSNTGVHGIVIGVYAESYSEVTSSFIERLEGNDFTITKYDYDDECIESVESGTSHVCITFPVEITADDRIEFHVDYSRLNMVFVILDILSSKVIGQSKEISLGIVSELIDKMKTVTTSITDNTQVIDQLQTNAETLGVKIVGIKQEVQNLNMSFDLSGMNFTDMKDDISANKGSLGDYETNIQGQIKSNRAKLKQFRSDAVEMKEYVDEQKAKKDAIQTAVNKVYADRNCASQSVTDLSPYLDDADALAAQIDGLTDPDCSFLFTIKKTVDQNGAQLDTTSQQLGALITNIDDAVEELDEMQKQTDTAFDTVQIELIGAESKFSAAENSVASANQRIKTMNATKNDFAKKLDEISQSVNSSLGQFEQITNAMNVLNENIKNVSIINPETVINPIATQIKPLTTDKKTLDYLFPSLIILILMFVSILLSSSLVMREKESRASFRNLIAPINNYVFVLGTYITALLVTLMQVGVIVLIATLFFHISLLTNISSILVLVILTILVFSGIGIIISNIFRSEETATIASIIISCILFLFSNVIVPIEKMSETMAMIAKINPFVVAEFILSKVLLFNKPIFSMGSDLAVLLLQLVVIGVLAVFSYKSFIAGEKNG